MMTRYFEDRRYAPRVTLHRWGPHGGQMWSRCSRAWVWDGGMVLRYQHGLDVFDLDAISEDEAMAHFPEAFGLPPRRHPYRLPAPPPPPPPGHPRKVNSEPEPPDPRVDVGPDQLVLIEVDEVTTRSALL
jgi:hypothetical protein